MSEPLLVVGGVYAERCLSPDWNAVYGSAGRAAAAINELGHPVELRAYMCQEAQEQMLGISCLREGFGLKPEPSETFIHFRYLHDLATPEILGLPTRILPPLAVEAAHVLRFGMLESTAIVKAQWAVYDPQNQGAAEPFTRNGSSAEHLALVLNLVEARMMAGLPEGSPADCADAIQASQSAEVVVIKMGPSGALVADAEKSETVPAYRSDSVWKVGSGDVFAATFAAQWMAAGKTPKEAADLASRATAFYCGSRGFITAKQLGDFSPRAITPTSRYLSGKRSKVYLAGPFFDLAQIWMVEQARLNLHEVGLDVFSPYHDIGLGSAQDVAWRDLKALDECDLMFAIADGADTGTVFEVGYAVAKGKPVIVLSQRESEESLKMMSGTGCTMCSEYASAVYEALWAAAEL